MPLTYYLERFHELPRPALQKKWTELSRIMRIHTQGRDAMEILVRRHTREDEASFQWRKNNFAAISKPVIRKAISRLASILNDSGYFLRVSGVLEAKLKERAYYGTNFFSFFQRQLIQTMIEDPNGVLVWLPRAAEPFAVQPKLIDSANIYFQDENVLIYLSDEKAPLETANGQTVETGAVYYLLSANEIIRISETGRAGDTELIAAPYYAHGLGVLPFLTLGGDYVNDGYFESYFQAFVPFANEALKQFSDWQVVMADSAFPIKEIQPSVCDADGCDHGYLIKDGKKQICSQCNGTGYYIKTGPFAALIRPETSPLAAEHDSARPLLSYITPPTEVIKYAQEAWQTLLERAEDALNLGFTREAQSGLAKNIDRDGMYAMLDAVATNVYDHLMYESLRILEGYYNGQKFEEPVVQKPATFTLKSESELLNDYQTFSQSGTSQAFAQQAAVHLADKKFGADGLQRRIQEIIGLFDPLAHENFATQQARLSAKVATPADLIRSSRAAWATRSLVQQYGADWFLQTDAPTILKAMEDVVAPFLNA